MSYARVGVKLLCAHGVFATRPKKLDRIKSEDNGKHDADPGYEQLGITKKDVDK